MRRFSALLALAAFLQAQTPAPPPGDDVLLRAMRDEVARASTLSLPTLEKPYYVEYTLDDLTSFSTSASLGASMGATRSRVRIPRVRVRVGDYGFDNTNYMYSDFTPGTRYDPDQFPLDDNYLAHRHGWWLATDRAYKGAVEAIGRKRAALKNVTQTELLPDFWKAQPLRKTDPRLAPADLSAWTDRVRALSDMFRQYPEVLNSGVSFSGSSSNYYMVNSEGSAVRRPEPLVHLQVQAAALAPDGRLVRDSVSLPRITPAELPQEAELRAMVTSVGENLRALVKAPVGENYSGPVLFEGVSGAQILAELLVPNLAPGRRPVSDPGRTAPFLPSEFEGRLESRVLPDGFEVIDDPSQTNWKGQPLIGRIEQDEEGVPALPLKLVENGRLKMFTLTRQPVKGFEASNGRARMPGPYGARSASVTNLLVRTAEPQTAANLKASFLKMLEARNKPWGILIRKMDFPSSAPNDEVRRMATAASQSGSVRLVSAPVLAFKVYPDGREELVRGLRFRGLAVRALRDVVAASGDQFAVHYLHNMAPMALLSSGGYVAPVSVVGPSLLFEELELERSRDEVPSPPLVPPPPLTAAR